MNIELPHFALGTQPLGCPRSTESPSLSPQGLAALLGGPRGRKQEAPASLCLRDDGGSSGEWDQAGACLGHSDPVQRNRRTGRGRARIPLEGGTLAKCPTSVCRAGLPLHTRSSGSASRALSPAAQAPRPGRQGERAQRKPRAPRGPTPQQQPLTSFCARAGHTQGTPGTHTHRAHRAHGAHAAHTHLPLTENSGARGSLEGSGSPFTSQAKGSEGLLPHGKSLPNTNVVS